MPRSLWNGAIAFGMVTIPISLSPAVGEKHISFNQLHKECGSRIKLQKYCPTCKRVVEPSEIERGYEYTKGHYITVTDEDMANLPVPSKQTISIQAFVKASEIDPVYYDTSYAIEPNKMGKKPYALLLKALETKNVVAIAKVALREKEHLCLLRASGKHLVMETLFYPDEVRESIELSESDLDISDKELKMAESLVEMLSEDFEPEAYRDTYREKLVEMIEAKAEGQEIKAVTEPEPESNVIDLMDALRASVEAAKKRKSG